MKGGANMAVHIFVLNEDNYQICIKKGIVGLPEAKNTNQHDSVSDGLLSRLACIKEDDYILMYIAGTKELRGVWQADGEPYYEESKIWDDKTYPFRCRIKYSKFSFKNSLKLSDINDLRNTGKIWTWTLQRGNSSNAMFSISNYEFQILLNEYMKINPFTLEKGVIAEPSPFHRNNVIESLHVETNKIKYEYTVMAYLNDAFSKKKYSNLFGNYSDFLCYVPVNLSKEIDILLMFENPDSHEIISYDIIEVKKDKFDRDALSQLINYESWFLQKKVSGDLNMIRTTAIAKSFDKDVIAYVNDRKEIEKKPIKLIQYKYSDNEFWLEKI